MILEVYCMRDSMTGFLTPCFEQNENTAKRNFAFAINSKDTVVYANPSHFDLYKIGTYDSSTGTLIGINPELVVTGQSVFKGDKDA